MLLYILSTFIHVKIWFSLIYLFNVEHFFFFIHLANTEYILNKAIHKVTQICSVQSLLCRKIQVTNFHVTYLSLLTFTGVLCWTEYFIYRLLCYFINTEEWKGMYKITFNALTNCLHWRFWPPANMHTADSRKLLCLAKK